MSEYSNEFLEKMHLKKKYNKKYAKYFMRMYKDYGDQAMMNRARSMEECLNFWQWDMYKQNKLLDLQVVSRCRNNRFCPNCKWYDTIKFIHKFREILAEFPGYHYYFLTLTIPSCNGEDLRSTIEQLYSTFAIFKEKMSYPKFTPTGKKAKKAFQERLVDISGGIRVLEITHNLNHGYHPHLHCVVLCKDKPNPKDLIKIHQGRYSTKRAKYDTKSNIEYQISKIWSMLWANKSVTTKSFNETEFNISDNTFDGTNKVLEIDFKDFTEKGVYEVIKYTFKDIDIQNYEVFSTLYYSLFGKRIRQGFGNLYNAQVEDCEVGEQQDLNLIYEEDPEDLIIKCVSLLYTEYQDYQKISRFQLPIDDNIK